MSATERERKAVLSTLARLGGVRRLTLVDTGKPLIAGDIDNAHFHVTHLAFERYTARYNASRSSHTYHRSNVTDTELDWIGCLTQLVSLDLTGCQHMTSTGFACLRQLHQLKILNLAGCDNPHINGIDSKADHNAKLTHVATLLQLESLNLSDWYLSHCGEGLAQLCSLQKLTSLNLSLKEECMYFGSMSSASMEPIAKLTQLTTLSLAGRRNICDEGIAHISQLEHLTYLDLSCMGRHIRGFILGGSATRRCWCHPPNRALACTGPQPFPKLASLNLQHCKHISDDGLAQLLQFDHLATLNIEHGGHITDDGLIHIGKLLQLTALHLPGQGNAIPMCMCDEDEGGCTHCADENEPSNVTDAGIGHLVHLQRLTHFSIKQSDTLTDTCLVYIGEFSSLTNLNLSECGGITGTGFVHLAKLDKLINFELPVDTCKCRPWSCRHDCTIAMIAQLPQMKSLTTLQLWRCRIGDVSLAHICQMTQLVELTLGDCSGVIEGLANVCQLQGLTTLVLNGCKNFTYADLEYASQLQNLTVLRLGGFDRFTEDHFVLLCKLCNLTTLSFRSGGFSGKGLRCLRALKSLRSLSFSFCVLTNAGLDELAQLSIVVKVRVYSNNSP